jgi:hypothetical protein
MTLEEMLKQQGKTDEEIKAIITTLGPAKGIFETQMAEATRKHEEATRLATEAQEREKKINTFWTEEATPQINSAFSEKAKAEAQAEFYRKQAESAKASGFLPADAPGFVAPNPNPGNSEPARDHNGKFVTNANPVPGSPQYLTMEQGYAAVVETAYLLSEHQRLFGEPLPDLEILMKEATQTRSKARDIWAKKYNVEQKRADLKKAAEDAHEAKLRAEIEKNVRTEYASKYGNENTRPMVPSRFPNYAKDEKTGAPDKMAWTKSDKRDKLRERIHDQVNKEARPN